MAKEVWKEIKGYDKGYEVSNLGRVRSYKRRGTYKMSETAKTMSPNINRTHCKEYYKVRLMSNGITKTVLVHRLVAIAFIDNPENKKQVHHIDNNGLNNELSNLEWCTNSENQRYRFTGSNKRKIGRDRNSYRVFFVNKEGKRTSKNFRSLKEAELFNNSLI